MKSAASVMVLGVAMVTAVSGCDARTCRGQDVDGAWRNYAAGRVDDAYGVFVKVVDGCPRYIDGKLGLGYAALRRGELDLAEQMFEAVLKRKADAVEALLGRGMVHWKKAEFAEARRQFERVTQLSPGNAQALDYLGKFPSGPPIQRPPLVLPDTLGLAARVTGRGFEIRGPQGWESFYVKGVNIGAAVPGSHASQFPDSGTYAVWLRLIAAMDANTVRLYTMHPPHFYQALLDYNRSHPGAPLRLIQGVWAELPPNDIEYDDTVWKDGFYRDMETVVDIIHGRADLGMHPGRASGQYTADVADWTLGYILGREWEPHSVIGYNNLPGRARTWSGRYVTVARGTPIDVWLAQAIDAVVAYETTKYRAQRPVAYTNWPPTDPLHHPTEADMMQERRIRQLLGDTTRFAKVVAGGNDAVSLDPLLIRSTDAFRAGQFASYHVYPYYPDFLVLDPELNKASSPLGRSNYWGYLEKLKEHHGDMPVLIAEYGVPASIGIAHFQPQGWHQGGHSEARMAEINARMTREIALAGMAGGIVFEWLDEWFKKTWNTTDFEVPRERDRLWYNRMDAEEHYGVLAAEPAPILAGSNFEARDRSWQTVPVLIKTPDSVTVRAAADEAYLWLHVGAGTEASLSGEVLIGFDMVDPTKGEFRWPGVAGAALPIGLEFVLSASRQNVRLLAHPNVNPMRIDTLGFRPPGAPQQIAISGQGPGFFSDRSIAEMRQPLQPRASHGGKYEGLRVVPNRLRFGRDSTEYAAMGYDWGILRGGPMPDGLWEWQGNTLEVRIPWQLLNVSDPSQRTVLSYANAREGEELGTVPVPGIRLLLGLKSGSAVRTWPAARKPAEVPMFTWTTWQTPRWKTRVRPTYWTIREAWRTIDPGTVASGLKENR